VQIRDQRRLTAIDKRRVESLLYPVAAFLRGGGLTKAECARRFMAAFDRSMNAKTSRQMEHIGRTTGYADIVTFWTRNKEFLDRSGRPRALSLRGRSSFTALVRRAAPKVDARKALDVLIEYGNVRKKSDEKYELVRPFFVVSSQTKMAFEPVVEFLGDAGSTLSKILRRSRNSSAPQLFWRKVESTRISDADAGRFNAFASERSLLFLEEMEDWLEAHGRNFRRRTGGTRRVGLGVFLIYSDPEMDR
jgi:hypothetical protein